MTRCLYCNTYKLDSKALGRAGGCLSASQGSSESSSTPRRRATQQLLGGKTTRRPHILTDFAAQRMRGTKQQTELARAEGTTPRRLGSWRLRSTDVKKERMRRRGALLGGVESAHAPRGHARKALAPVLFSPPLSPLVLAQFSPEAPRQSRERRGDGWLWRRASRSAPLRSAPGPAARLAPRPPPPPCPATCAPPTPRSSCGTWPTTPGGWRRRQARAGCGGRARPRGRAPRGRGSGFLKGGGGRAAPRRLLCAPLRASTPRFL